jgi:spermidine/putrescine transport system substrate-binding protein
MPQDILDDYTAEYGVPIRYIIYSDQQEALDHMVQGEQFDVVVLSNVYVPIAAEQGLLAELPLDTIPNFRNLEANFRNLAYDPENRYSIMIQWGTTGIVARTDRWVEPVTSWDDLWNPAYAGKIGVWPYPTDLIGITLKSLGYSYNSENPAELKEAGEKLLRLRRNIYFLDPTLSTGVHHLLDDKTAMIYGWSYDAMQAQELLDTSVYILPKEGTFLWTDNVTIPANSRQKQEAQRFINFLLRPEISAIVVNEMWVSSANEAARTFVKPEILNNPLVYPAPESLRYAEFPAVLSEETQKIHAEIWARFLAEEGSGK